MTRGKSDRIDAFRIASYAQTFIKRFTPWHPPRKPLLKIKRLYALREKIKKNINQYLSPSADFDFLDDAEVIKLQKRISKKLVATLKAELKNIEDQIRAVIAQDPQLKRLFAIVLSVDGIGFISALNFVIHSNEFQSIQSPKQFACYCGVAPFEHSSGSSIRSKNRVSHLANKSAKSVLHLASMSAIKMEGELQDYFTRKVEEGKPKLVALNAVRNKLIHRVFACVKRNEPFQKIRA